MLINTSLLFRMPLLPQVSAAGIDGAVSAVASAFVNEALPLNDNPNATIIESGSDLERLFTDFVFGRMKDGQTILIRRDGSVRPLKNRIFQIPNDGMHTKATDENGRVYSVNTGELPVHGLYWGILPKYFEKFGRKYDTSGNHDNVRIFRVLNGNIIKWLKPEEVRKVAARHFGLSLPKFGNDRLKNITHEKKHKLRRKALPKNRVAPLYEQEITISAGKFERKIKIAIEAPSKEEFKEIRQEVLYILMNTPSALLSVVKRIEIYQGQSTFYGLDVSKEPIGGHYKHAGNILRIFSFSMMQEGYLARILHHELWHSVTFERDKASLLLAIKAGGKEAEKLLSNYSEMSGFEHHHDSWAEYAATAGGMLLYLGASSECLLDGPLFIVSVLTYLAERSFVSIFREKRVDVVKSKNLDR